MSCDWFDDEAMLAAPPDAIEAHLAHCEHCRAQLQRDGKIATLIARGATSHQLPPDWNRRTLARVRAAGRARRRRIAALSALGAAAAAAIAVLMLRVPERGIPASPPLAMRDDPARADGPQLALEILAGSGRRSADPSGDPGTRDPSPPVVREHRSRANPGDELQAQASVAGAAHFALRVYRGGHLVAACPDDGATRCLAADRTLLAWTFPEVGTFQVILLVSQQPIAPPRGSLDADVTAAITGGARLVGPEDIDVR